MKKFIRMMIAATAGMEQAVHVWETMKHAEQLALTQLGQVSQQQQRQVGFAATGIRNELKDLQNKETK